MQSKSRKKQLSAMPKLNKRFRKEWPPATPRQLRRRVSMLRAATRKLRISKLLRI